MRIIYNKIKLLYLKWKYKNSRIDTHQLAKDLILEENVGLCKGCRVEKNCFIGKNSYVGSNTVIDGNTIIGKFCSIGPNVYIAPGNHPTHLVTTHPILYDKNWQKILKIGKVVPTYDSNDNKDKVTPITRIGNDVWIGVNAIILQGVTIGNGAIIGAGAVVTKDVKPYEIVAGNPAKHIRFRFSTEEILKLQQKESQWWTWSKERLKKDIDKLYDIQKYINN